MSKPSPLVLVALAGGAWLLYRRAQAQRAAVTGPVSAQRTADYFNPVDVAGQLARLVIAATKNIGTEPPAGIFGVVHPIVAGSPESGLAGWDRYAGALAGVGAPSGDPYNDGSQAAAWSAPTSSPTSYGTNRYTTPSVDGVVSAPVYDLRTDYINNPLTFGSLFVQ